MKQEDKELLLKDLCSRLSYGVKIQVNDKVEILEGISILDNVVEYGSFLYSNIEEIKPYLFPISSMTEEQRNEFDTQTFKIMFGECICNKNDEMGYGKLMNFDLNFYNKHHLDWRGLIQKGLAIDATNLNIY